MANPLGVAVCKSLGIEPRGVKQITLTLHASGESTATVEHSVYPVDEERLTSELTTYDLTKRDE